MSDHRTDIRGAKNHRNQLEKHRASATAGVAIVQSIRPAFALENFDAIGRWRGHYRKGLGRLPVDASGAVWRAEFQGRRRLQKALLEAATSSRGCVARSSSSCPRPELDVLDRPGHPPHRRDRRARWIRLRDLVASARKRIAEPQNKRVKCHMNPKRDMGESALVILDRTTRFYTDSDQSPRRQPRVDELLGGTDASS